MLIVCEEKKMSSGDEKKQKVNRQIPKIWSVFFYQQVDLHTLKVLTGIATQGAISKETKNVYYVSTFKLEVSTNGEDWMIYRHGKNHKVSTKILCVNANSHK